MSGGIRCALMRGGTSKGAVFLADDLPRDVSQRDALLLRIMGSPDPRQIDGLGGGHPLTSKVAVVSTSDLPDVDVDYLFLQVVVDQATVSTSQTCGNMLAAVGPFAILRGLVRPTTDSTEVRVRLVNNDAHAALQVRTPGGVVTFDGDTQITGVPGTAAPIHVVAQPQESPLLPTGNVSDHLAGLDVTCIDNGMPSVLVRAHDLHVSGTEAPEELEANDELVSRIKEIRAAAAQAMRLPGDLADTTVPKIVLVAPPQEGGHIGTRSFIPERVHEAIGVLGAASVAAAVRLSGTTAHDVAKVDAAQGVVRIEHPTGYLDVDAQVGDDPEHPIGATSVIRTARLILDGTVYPGPARDTTSHGDRTSELENSA